MAYKTVCFVLLQAFLIQDISAQYLGCNGLIADYGAYAPLAAGIPALGAPLPPIATPCAGPLAYGAVAPIADIVGFSPTASYGGSFAVSSYSPVVPTGISVTSENVYEGGINVFGKLPFLSAVALEGTLPTGGVGAITYSCGNGNIAILNEEPLGYPEPYGYGPVGYGAPLGYGPLGYNGYAGLGCGGLY